jgi:hypothetical protein
MAQNVITNKNRKNGYVTINVGSGGAWYLNNSNVTLGCNAAGEVVQSMNIVGLALSSGNGVFYTIKRGANTIAVMSGNDDWELNDGRLIDTTGGEPQANLVITKTGAGPATLIVKLHKISAITGGSIY